MDARLRRYSDEAALELTDLIQKRLDQGLTPTIIAGRLGVKYEVVKDMMHRRGKIMAETKVETKAEVIPNLLSRMRETIGKVKAGMHTHQAEDTAHELGVILDELEKRLKKGDK